MSPSVQPKLRIRIEASCALEVMQPSGIGRYTEQLIAALQNDPRIDLDIVTGPFPKPWVIPNKIFRKINHYLPTHLQPPFDIFMSEVDLTIFPNFSSLATSKSAKRSVIIHDLVYKQNPETVESKNLTFLSKEVPRSIETCDSIITTTEIMAKAIKDGYGPAVDSDILTLPIPVDPKYYVSTNRTVEYYADKYSFQPGKYVYFIGNMEPRKNLATLIDAYVKLPNETKAEYSLVVAGGKGWKSDEILQKITELRQRGEKLYSIGYVDEADAPGMMELASLHCLPSKDEGFGTSLYQAMATRTPILASDIPILREVAKEYAVYANTNSSDDLSQAIQQALASSTAEKTELAYTFVKSITWEEQIHKIIDHISERAVA